MGFEFLLIAMIDGQAPLVLDQYDGPTAWQCMRDAEKLHQYLSAGYVKQPSDAGSSSEITKRYISEYQEKYGELDGYSEKIFELNTPEAEDFLINMRVQKSPEIIALNMRNMPREQADLLLYAASSYVMFADALEADDDHKMFQEILDSGELDKSSMFSGNELSYRCLPSVE